MIVRGNVLDSPARAAAAPRKPRLAVIVSSHWPIRNLLLTRAFRSLGEDFDLLAWAPESLLPRLREVSQELEVGPIDWRPLQPLGGDRLHRLAYRLQKSVLLERHHVATERLLQRRTGRRTPLQRVAAAATRVVARTPLATPAYGLASVLRRWATPAAHYGDDFADFAPDIVLSTNAIDPSEDAIYYEALRRRVPVVSMVSSWDNLAKGPVHAGYAAVLCWNRVMVDSLHAMYPAFDEAQLPVIGIPRFDIYREPLPRSFARAPFLSRLGLDPARKVVLYASNGSWKNFPTEREVIRHVYDDVVASDADLQLLIRPHPHEDLRDYDTLRALPRVGLCAEPTSSMRVASRGDIVPATDSLWELAACLKHSAVCVNAASTISLDAVACDVPVISVAYDGDSKLPPHDSIATAYEFTHQPPFLRFGATTMARSRSELQATLRDALTNADRHRANRQQAAEAFLNCHRSSTEALRQALLAAVEARA